MGLNKDKNPNEKPSKKQTALLISSILTFAIFSVFILVKFYPLIIDMASSPEKMMEFKAWIESYGIWGGIILMIIQIVQVIVSIIPGGPIQILFGLIYGTWKGLLLSLTGMFIGSMVVFFLVRAFKHSFITLFINKDKIDEYKFLKDSPKRERILAILFLIPGAPKDTLVYYASMTSISIKKFIFIAVLMRIPSMIFSTLIGNGIGNGDIVSSAYIFASLCVIGCAGMIYNRLFIKNLNSRSLYQDIN